RRLGHGRHAHRHEPGPAREGGDDRHAQPALRRPHRRQGKGGEAVGAARLARPQVGVAEGGGGLDPLPLGVEGGAVEGDGDAVAVLGHRFGVSLHSRTTAVWLAVASRVPSRAHRALRPSPGGPGSSSGGRARARRISMRLSMVPAWRSSLGRTGHASGGGTSGGTAHEPEPSKLRRPRAALTVKISLSPTWPVARTWLTLWPAAASTTSMSTTDGE